MRRATLILLIAILLVLPACTEKERARTFGGTTTTVLPKGQKLVIATWKGDNLWLLTRPMKEGETPEVYTFKEDSAYGVMEGTAIIKEQR